jgi:hypothetical protein
MTMSLFVLPSQDVAALQSLVDVQLNAPMGQDGRFRVVAPVVTLSIAEIDLVASEVAPFSNMGALSEREAAFWIPILDTQATGVQPLSFMNPYIFVDNPLALTAGRELEGFFKDPAEVTVPTASAPGPFAVDALTVVTFGPGATVTRARLVEVTPPATPGGSIIADGLTALNAVRTLVRGLGNIGRDWHEAMAMLHTLEQHALQSILLKQMRDVVDGLRACYQAVVQVPLVVTAFESLRVLDAHEVTITSTDSHPLATSLGLAVSQRSLIALALRFDAQVPNGQILWQA